jgi:hypothetical protein
MRLQSLKRVVDVVAAMLRPEDMTVLGSSALLAVEPELGDSGAPLETSLDADLLVEPCDENQAAVVDEAVGEGSLFHREFGVYADLMRPSIAETLPPGWRERRLPLPGTAQVRCLDPYDVAIVKLTLGRPKDMALLRALVARGTLSPAALRSRYQATPMNEADMFRAGRNLGRLIG